MRGAPDFRQGHALIAMKLLVSASLAAAILIAALVAALSLGGARRDEPDGPVRAGASSAEPRAPEGEPPPRAANPGDPASARGARPAAPPVKAARSAAEPPAALAALPPGDAEVVFIVSRAGAGPLAGAQVTLFSGRSSGTSATDRSGVAAFPQIAADIYTFRVDSAGSPSLSGAREITLSPGERKEIPLEIGDFRRTIRGRVLDRAGTPVEGIAIQGRKHVIDASDSLLVPTDGGGAEASSGPDGTYEVGGLDDGDYILTTTRTESYPAVRKIFRSGTQAADIVLDAMRELLVTGIVKSRAGEPIAGASVVPLGQPDRRSESDGGGRYEATVSLTEGQTVHLLTVMKEGFRDARVQFRFEDVGTSPSWEVDVVMDPLGARAPVSGTLRDAAGTPVARQSIFLHSASLGARYQALSAEDGTFSMGEVQVGADYRLWVYPRSSYRDRMLENIVVPEEGLEVPVVLDPIDEARLRGVMVDPAGQPVPRFTLWLRSMKALGNSLSVTGDQAGAFEIDGVPEGEILFETRSLPRFTIRGVELSPGRKDDIVTLVVDHGTHTLSGNVVEEGGAPVAGAAVSLYWTHSSGTVQSSSFRSTVTDGEGRFSFGELANGEHKVSVNSAGHAPSYTLHDVGGGTDAVIELKTRR